MQKNIWYDLFVFQVGKDLADLFQVIFFFLTIVGHTNYRKSNIVGTMI